MKINLLFLVFTLTSYSVFSAELVEGEREGKIKFHGKEFVSATFVVRSVKKGNESGYKIEMIHDERLYDFEKLTFEGEDMMFVLDTGQKYNCVLSREEKVNKDIEECSDKKGYCGECIHLTDDEKQKLIIINIKPASNDPAPQEQVNAEVEDESRG